MPKKQAIKVNTETPDFIPAEGAPDFIPAEGESHAGKLQPQGGPSEAAATGMLQIGTPETTGEFLKGAGKGALNTISGISSGLNKIPIVGKYLAPPEGIAAMKSYATPKTTPEKLGYFGEQAGEFMLPGAAEEAAMAHIPQIAKGVGMGARAIKMARPAVKIGMQALDSGIINKVHGDSFKEGAEAGAGGALLGEAANAVAPHIAESAMGITRRAREYGRTPGAAILEDTKGVRPATVARNAGSRIADKTKQMEGLVSDATNAGQIGTTQPAHDVLNDEIARAPRNARSYSAGLTGLRDLLHFDTPGTTKAPRFRFTPDELLEMKRGIGAEVSNWNPEMRQGLGPVSRRLYSPIDKELDTLAPGAEKLNQSISSLIPARDFMQRRALGAGMGQRIAGRVAAHTGALATSLAGGIGGYRHGGIGEGILGATAGLVAPEALASPTGQMALARALHSFSGRLPVGLSLQAIKALREEQEPTEEGGTR